MDRSFRISRSHSTYAVDIVFGKLNLMFWRLRQGVPLLRCWLY